MASSKSSWRRVVAGLAVGLALAAVGLVLALDTLLTSRARAAAAELSRTLGRPVQVGRVSLSLQGGLTARASDLEVGAGPGEPAPLARVASVAVAVDAWRALSTLGREVPVRSAVVSGLEVAVFALPDGTTNLERVAAAAAGPASPDAGVEAPPDRSAVRVDHLELAQGRVTLTDLRPGAGPPVEVKALTLTIEHLQAGQPLLATLTAAALADQPNLELRLQAGPLPPSLVPVPERLAVKLQPLDLAPLAPFLPRQLGLRAGRVDADLALAMGAAVPGGTGPTTLKGVLHARGLRFAGAGGAHPLDAALDADVTGDLAAGDVTLTRLELTAGPAGAGEGVARLSGTGRVLGLLGAAPRAEAFSVLGSGLDPQLLTASFPALARLLPGEVAGPVGLVLVAGGTAERPSVSLQLELTPVRLRIPGQLAKAAGAPMRLVGTVRGQGGGTLAFTAHAELAGADLRPGGLLAKGPGAPLQVSATGTVHPGAPFTLALTSYQAQLLEDTLAGSAAVERTPAGGLSAVLTLRGARLDLGRLLLQDEAPPAEGAAPAAAAEPGAAVEPVAKDPTAGLAARAEVQLGALRTNGLEASQVGAAVTLAGGVLSVQRAAFTAAGGTFTLDGSTVTLSRPTRPFSARLRLEHLDVKEALQVVWPDHRVLEGRFDGTATLTGEQRALASTLAGQLDGTLHDGTFVSLDAVGAVLGPLLARLPFMQGLGGGRTGTGATTLGTIPLGLTFKDGTALLKAPIQARTVEAAVTLSGGVGLDGTLRMPARVELMPALLAKATLGKVSLSSPVPVGFTLAGPAWKPQVTDLDLAPAVATLVASVAGGAVGQVLGGLGTLLGGGAAPPRPAAPPDAGAPPALEDEAARALKRLLGR